MSDADKLIALLELKEHPEGGHYRETFRDRSGTNGRALSTAIYFLLRKGEISHRHRIDAAEVWHWYKGAPLELEVSEGAHKARVHVLGNDFARGEESQVVVPARAWQSARSLGEYSLVGCTVAPGFDFGHFELAPRG